MLNFIFSFMGTTHKLLLLEKLISGGVMDHGHTCLHVSFGSFFLQSF